MRVWVTSTLLLLMATATEASSWLEVRSPRFEIFTDAGESAARQLVIDLEQFDGAIAHSLPIASPYPTGPQRVYLFRSEQEFAEFRQRNWTVGLTITPGNRAAPFILLFASPNLRETAIHEYVHAMVRRGDWTLPPWFEEGLAEIYAHSDRAGHGQLSIGRKIPEHLVQLKNQTIISSMLLDEANDSNRLRFYAASWAMVHMLLLEDKYRPLTERLLTDGAWDASLPDLLKDLKQYVERPFWKQATVNAPLLVVPDLSVKPVEPTDAEFMLAALLLDAGRTDAARKSYQKIASAYPHDAVGAEAAGFSALSQGRPGTARQEFRRAANLGSTRARVWSELAALEREARVPWDQVKSLLERAATLDPSEYQAAFLLGVHESDDGDLSNATRHLASAAKAAPALPDVWHAYALALRQAGRLDEARVAAKRALRVASSPEWARMASELVASLDQNPAAKPPALRRKPEVVTSPAWTRPVPDAEVVGKFLEFVCSPHPPRFRVEVEGGTVIELVVADPTQVSIPTSASGESSMELRCGPQNGRPIRVGFRRADGTVLDVKFPQVPDSQRF